MFAAYTTSYKDFKDKFFRVQAGPACPTLLVNSSGLPRFSLHWTINPKSRNSYDRDLLTEAEVRDVDWLSRFKTMKCFEVLDWSTTKRGYGSMLVITNSPDTRPC